MSIFINSKQALLNYLNGANSTTLFTLTNLVWSQPQPVAGSWMEGTTLKNTFMKVNAAPDAPFKGRQTIKWDRLELGDFSHFKPTRGLPAYLPATTHDLIPNILYYFGLFLTTDDIVSEPVVLDVQGAGTVTITAKPTSVLWTGSLSFDVVQGGANIATLLVNKELDGLKYPVSDPATQTSALIYAYPMDMTAYRDQFLAIAEGTLTQEQATLIVNALKAVDSGTAKALWTDTAGATAWALAGAKVVHNGLNGLAYPTNQSYKYIMALELRADVTVPTGRFFLHYNDPDDPNSAT